MNLAMDLSLRQLNDDDQEVVDELNRREDVQLYLFEVAVHPKRPARLHAIVVGGTVAGIVGLTTPDPSTPLVAELICAVRESFENKGVARVACQQLIDLEASAGQTSHIVACVSPSNSKSRKLCERLGFSRTGGVRFRGDEIWSRPMTQT